MGLRQYFEYRSGRVIVLFRAVLVLVFLLALLAEPVNGTDHPHGSLLLLFGYLVFSLLLLPISWTSWWYDQRLAFPALVVDVITFIAATFLTEALDVEFVSPFMAFFALIMLSATMRWDWRFAATTGTIVTLLFIAAGITMWWLQLPIEPVRFARRVAYMVVLFLVLVAFAFQRREPMVPPLEVPSTEGEDKSYPLDAALSYAMAQTGARCGAIRWSDDEEPWVELRLRHADSTRRQMRMGPEDFLMEAGMLVENPILFDSIHHRRLDRTIDNWAHCRPLLSPIVLAEHADIAEGIAIPIEAAGGNGQLVLGDIAGLGLEHIALARVINREIGAAFNRQAMTRLESEALLARTRNALARDLHDSVAQSLAGACFRLEGLRGALARGSDPDGQIVEIRDALRGEQRHVRRLIDGLRNPARISGQHDLGAELATVIADMGKQWGITTRLGGAEQLMVAGWMSHEVQQLVREAIANAARHGKAQVVTVNYASAADWLQLIIVDDGAGISQSLSDSKPWSISERIAALGGQLSIAPVSPGTKLVISLPHGATP